MGTARYTEEFKVEAVKQVTDRGKASLALLPTLAHQGVEFEQILRLHASAAGSHCNGQCPVPHMRPLLL